MLHIAIFLRYPGRKIYGAFVQLEFRIIAILLCRIFGFLEVALLLMFRQLVLKILDRRLRRCQVIVHRLLLLLEHFAFRFREPCGHEFQLVRKILRGKILEEHRLKFCKFRFNICNVAVQFCDGIVKRNFCFAHLLF